MENNLNLNELIENEVKSNVDKLELYSDNYPFQLSLRIRNFENESEYMKFIKNCERLVRVSLEYKLWRSYIIDVLGLNSCMITQERDDECSIEVHHHIPSLFAVIKSLVNKKITKEEEFSTFDISTECIELHFSNKIGYVVLVKTMHEKVHNGYLDIPIQMVKGDYKYFLENYSGFLDEEDIDLINNRLATKEGNCFWSRNNYPGERS